MSSRENMQMEIIRLTGISRSSIEKASLKLLTKIWSDSTRNLTETPFDIIVHYTDDIHTKDSLGLVYRTECISQIISLLGNPNINYIEIDDGGELA